MLTCERCGEKTAKIERCNYCGRHVCYRCIKAAKKVKRRDIYKIHICKDCWGKLELRKKYRHNEVVFMVEI